MLRIPQRTLGFLRHSTSHVAAWLAVALLITASWLHVLSLIEQDRIRTLAAATQNLGNLTRVAQEHAVRTFRSVDQTLRMVKVRYEEVGDKLDLKAMVAQRAIDIDIFNQIGIIDAQGIYKLSNLPIVNRLDLSDREHFKVHVAADKGELFISKALLGRASGKWSIQLSRRTNGKDGTFGGVVVASLAPAYFTHFFSDLDLGQGGMASLVGVDGEVRARKIGQKEEFGIRLSQSKLLPLLALGQHSGTFTDISVIDGLERIYFFRSIEPYRMAIIAGLSTKEVLLPHINARNALLFQVALATLLILALGIVFSMYHNRMRRESAARSQAAQKLTENEQRMALALDGADLGMWEWHIPAASYMPDVRMLNMVGYGNKAVDGSRITWREYASLLHPDDVNQIKAILRPHLKGETPDFEVIYRLRHKDQRWVWLLARGKVVERDRNGRAVRLAGTSFDVSKRMLAEQQLAVLNEQLALRASEAEAANQAKSAFLANMSHELRTPMNAVIGFAYVLEQAELSDDEHVLVRKIGIAGHALLAIINDVLDFSKIEAGKIEIKDAPFRLADVFDTLAAIMSLSAADKGIELLMTAPPLVNNLNGDALRLGQVLLNLVGNGVKFTERGHVHVDIVVQSESEQQISLRFAVRDTGIGIARERQDAIFESFAQEDDSITRRFGGSGLGLTISRRLVALMGGAIELVSVPGSGSEFCFTLSFGRLAQALAPAPQALSDASRGRRINGVRILVVDDSDINRDVAQRIFTSEGADVVMANDGRQAVDWLQAHPHDVDLVLMDVQMPVLDGYQATRLIRTMPELAGLPVIALTAGAFSGQEEAAHSAGMNGFIGKPFDVDAAIALIRKLTGPTAQAAGIEEPGPGQDASQNPPVCNLPGLAVVAGLTLWKDASVYRQYLRKFAHHYAGSVRDMAQAGPAAAALAHKMAGAAGSLALEQVAAQAKEADRALRAGDDPAQALASLQAALDTALESIGRYAPAEAAAVPG